MAIELISCVSTTADSILLIIFILISILLIVMGMVSRIKFIGLFGSIMLFITSWYLFACIFIFALALMFFSFLFFIFFVVMKEKEGN